MAEFQALGSVDARNRKTPVTALRSAEAAMADIGQKPDRPSVEPLKIQAIAAFDAASNGTLENNRLPLAKNARLICNGIRASETEVP